jgi:hypothetical protein
MKAFLFSDAGKGTIGVCLACLIIVVPVVGTWLVAGLTLLFAAHHLREAFRRIEEEPERSLPRIETPDAESTLAMSNRTELPPCDVEAVMADLAAKAVLPGHNGR